MVQYYTLEEAARILQTSQDEVKKLAETKKVRTFRDRGTLRFRAQEIDELARARGLGSDPELQLGEVPPPKRTAATDPAKTTQKVDGGVFDFSLTDDSDQVEIGQELQGGSSASSSGRSSPASSGRLGSPRSPAPKPGSDSDVRLVADGSELDFQVSDESAPKSSSGSGKKKGTSAPTSRPDSGARIVPLADDSDSDVKMVLDEDDAVVLGGGKQKSGSDSDIRLEHTEPPVRLASEGSDPSLVTEEIDLDAEIRKQQASQPASKSKPKTSAPKLPTTSPFELSEADLDLEKPTKAKNRRETQHAPAPLTPDSDSSEDFDLTPNAGSLSPLELSDEELTLSPEDQSDEVPIGKMSPSPGGSGINLKEPIDSGISLEDSSDSVEFELTLDDPGTKPKSGKKGPAKSPAKPPAKPAAKAPEPDDSSSEFELSLDDSSGEGPAADNLDSEFELSLESEGSSEFELEAVSDDSSSEFELTLDESGGMEAAQEEKDIFETDFEVPALDEDSGSEAVALEDSDTDLESSDFDIALDEGDAEIDDESASQVVALEDEEEAEEGAATVSRPRGGAKRKAAAIEEEEEDFGGIDAEVEGEEEMVGVGAAREAAPTPWGPLPALLLLLCLFVLIVIGFMGYEMLQGMWGYQRGSKVSSLVIHPLAEAILGEKLPE